MLILILFFSDLNVFFDWDLIQFHFMAVLCGESCFSGNVIWKSGGESGPISA